MQKVKHFTSKNEPTPKFPSKQINYINLNQIIINNTEILIIKFPFILI